MGTIWEIYGTDAHAMTLALLEAADAERLVPHGGSVALKPNLVLASPPEEGATTHAGVLSGCIEFFQSHGIRDLRVIESSWVGAGTERSMKVCGYDRVCREYGVPFYDLKKDRTRRVETPLRPMEICAQALDADLLVDLPVLKGHCQTAMTCALKNLKGCLPDREKRRFHTEGLHRPIAALGAALRPGLIVVDGLCGDLDFEEGGTPVPMGRMALGTDPVQIDAWGCRLMGLDPDRVPYIRMAEAWGAGSAAIGEIVSLNAPKEAASYPAPSGTVRRLTRRVREDGACSACYAALVRGLYTAEREGVPPDRDIAIGQGWRGKAVPCLGIGNCCAGAAVHVPGCPPSASDVAEVLRSSGRA